MNIDPVGDTFSLSDVYAANGTYTVTVSLADASASTTGTYTIVVTGLGGPSVTPPTVNLGGNASVLSGATFTQTDSITDNGPGPLSATVDYGDGSGAQTLIVTAGGFTLSHVYAVAGTYTVTVTATDDGLTGSASISALVTNPVTQTAPTVNPDHTYANAGTYTITVTATDNGFTGSASISAVVQSAAAQTPPIVSLGNSTSATTGVPFTQSGSISDNGPGPLVATVDYGDGTGPQTLTLGSGGTFTLNHTYSQAGTYVITVAAADNGFTGSASIGAIVVDAVTQTPPSVTLGGNVSATAGTSFTQTGAIADAGPGPLTVTVNYGDGTSPQTVTVTAGGFTLSHAYALAGTYTVTVTATDNGLTGSSSISAIVNAATVTPNDKFTDLVAEDSTGVWHVARSTGTSFVDMSFGSLFDPTQTWIDILAADFTGDGRTDLAAMNAATGQWYVAVDTGVSFTVTPWDSWSPTVQWADVTAVDLDHDGKADIVGVNPVTGSWQASFSQGTGGATSVIGSWSPTAGYVDAQWADVNGDGRPDLVARVGDQVSTWFNEPVPGAVGSSAELVAATNPIGTLTPGSSSGNSGSGSGDSGSNGSGSGGSGSSGGSTSGSSTTPVTPTGPLFRHLTWMTTTPTTTTQQATQSTATPTTHQAQITVAATTTTATTTTSTTTTATTAAVIVTGFRITTTWNFMPATTTTTPPPSNPSGGSGSTGTTAQSFSQMQLGDLDGDGKADVVALSTTTNQWTVALSQGATLGTPAVWPGLSTATTWNYAKLVDLNGDGRMDLLLRSNTDGSWWAAYSTGTSFNVVLLGTTDPGMVYSNIVTGDFNGDGLDRRRLPDAPTARSSSACRPDRA